MCELVTAGIVHTAYCDAWPCDACVTGGQRERRKKSGLFLDSRPSTPHPAGVVWAANDKGHSGHGMVEPATHAALEEDLDRPRAQHARPPGGRGAGSTLRHTALR